MNSSHLRRGRRCAAVIVAVVGFGLTALAGRQSPDLTDVLRRSAQATARYAEQSTVILADESCQQRAYQTVTGIMSASLGVDRRRWKAEVALVQLPTLAEAGLPWVEVRDVVEVDGERLPGREERMERLFLSDPDWKTTKAREITQDSAKYNIGQSRRNINLPSIPLLWLYVVNQRRVAFQKAGEETIDGVSAWKVAFQELRTPALIRDGATGEDMPSAGTFWIDPVTGDVLRAELHCPASSENLVRVEYRVHETFGLRLPFEMTEKAVSEDRTSWAEGKCTYSNFRRFETRGRLLIGK
jgi:hypothetical protein